VITYGRFWVITEDSCSSIVPMINNLALSSWRGVGEEESRCGLSSELDLNPVRIMAHCTWRWASLRLEDRWRSENGYRGQDSTGTQPQVGCSFDLCLDPAGAIAAGMTFGYEWTERNRHDGDQRLSQPPREPA
jgi:hypothetical protein